MPRPLLLLLFPALVLAQGVPRIPYSGGFNGGPDGFKGDASFDFRGIQVTANAPYSGEDKEESVQTLADGTHITRSNSRNIKVYRDSQGRVRIEQPVGAGRNSGFPTLVQIDDPIAGYTYILDDLNKVAHRVKASSTPEISHDPSHIRRLNGTTGAGVAGVVGVIGGTLAGTAGGGAVTISTVAEAGGGGGGRGAPTQREAPAVRPRPQTSAPQDIGTQFIDGVAVKGSRTTTVYPVDSFGNDGPVTVTRETWYSPELNLVVRTVNTDPRSGVNTTGIGNLSRNEPDASLFMIPMDYKVVDEPSHFTINWDTRSSAAKIEH